MSRRGSRVDLAADEALARACGYLDRGRARDAFRIVRRLSADGYGPAMLNLGYCYDIGAGVRRNESKALYWYCRAYRRGDASGANDIATIYRDRGDLKRAAAWFSRAIDRGDDGGALELARST